MNIYWINMPTAGRLGIMARPRGNDWLEDDIRSLAMLGVDVVVCLLTEPELLELELLDEGTCCERQLRSFVLFPIPDRQTPPLNQETFTAIQRLALLLNDRKTIAIHCRMGIGRSSLIAAAILVLHGVDTDTAFTAIATARGCPVPDTPEQRAWVDQFYRYVATM